MALVIALYFAHLTLEMRAFFMDCITGQHPYEDCIH